MDRPAPKPSTSRIRERTAPRTDATKPKATIPAILDKLDAIDDSRFRNRREGDRDRFRRQQVPVKVMHPGGSTSERVVATRNLSPSGIGFIYDSFLHNGTRVVLRLPRRLGGEDQLAGKVVYCAHVSGPYHQVGVRFDRKIFVNLYDDGSDSAAGATGDSGAAARGASSGAELVGRLLLIDAQSMDRALVSHHLRDTQLRVVAVADEQAGVEALSVPGTMYDIVVCEMDVEARVSLSMILQLRQAGHTGPIVAAAAVKVDATHTERATSIGAAGIVSKPYDRTELLAMLAKQMTAAAKASSDPAAVAQRALERGVAEVKTITDVARSAGTRGNSAA